MTPAARHAIRVRVNGREAAAEVDARRLLVDFIREDLALTGTHVGCDTSNCGACTVLLDGRTVKSCTAFAVQADGRDLLTIEGLAPGEGMHPLQEAFHRHHALQCGYCTPGMILSLHHLLQRNPNPTEADVRRGIAGNLCRCTGYVNIVRAALSAAAALQGRTQG